ncbi:gp34 [Macrophomina phaseolina MS6]|uniref:Gp34 n=1 Tax=Macrophomina phaseolina (strain MS6) TaxID=1126212 RepID=K2RM09_MACPH|nr:gp34 [Macrophomina phaseolina MS6]
MFLPIVYETETSHGPDISSFYVKQDLFKSFFGDLYVMDRENAEAVIENISQSLPLESSPFMGICHGTCDTARAAREECQLSTRKIAELEAQISTYQSNGRHLDDMQQHLLDKTRECEDLTRRLRQGEDCVRREKQQQAASNDKIEEQGKKIKELASNLNNALEVHAQCANLTHEHEKRFNEIQARLTAKEAELRNILEDRDKLSAARENQEECSQILERIRGENKRLEQELKDLQVIVARSDEEAEMRSKEASILREEIKRLQDIETQTSTEKAATEQELDHLTRNNHEVEEQNKRLLEELADMRRQLLERTTRLEEADGRINSLETLFKSSEVKEMREMNQRLKKDKAELEKQIGDLQARQNHEVSTLQRRMTEASGFDDPRYQELFILARRAEHKAVAYPYCFTVVMGPQKRPIHIRLENDQHLHKTIDDIIAIITRIELETNGVWSIYALQEGKQPGKLPSTDNIVDVLKKCKNIYAGTQQHMDEWHNAQTTSLENKGKRKRLHGDA